MGFLGCTALPWSICPGPHSVCNCPSSVAYKAPNSPRPQGSLPGACTRNAFSLIFFSHPGLFLSSRFSFPGSSRKSFEIPFLHVRRPPFQSVCLVQGSLAAEPTNPGLASWACNLHSGTAGPRVGRGPHLVSFSADAVFFFSFYLFIYF